MMFLANASNVRASNGRLRHTLEEIVDGTMIVVQRGLTALKRLDADNTAPCKQSANSGVILSFSLSLSWLPGGEAPQNDEPSS